MMRFAPEAAFVLVLALGCGDQAPPTEAAADTAAPGLAAASRQVRILDRCEPASFNAVLGEGACVGDGKVTFSEFFAELEKKGVHHQWRFDPRHLSVQAGRPLSIENVGGEVHTFTRVAEFGGGIVPELNEVIGETEVAPECLVLEPADFLGAGSTTQVPAGLPAGAARFMCCIHPWMRTTARGH